MKTGEITGAARKTIDSLQKLSDFPFYKASYFGDYKLDEIMNGALESPENVVPFFERFFSDMGLPTILPSPGPLPPQGGCSAFFGKTATGEVLVGKNIDWQKDPLLLLKTKPTEGYQSLSISNLRFCDIFQTDSLPHQLLFAPFIPLDGMNEKGLVISMLAVDEQSEYPPREKGKITVGDFQIIRIILDTCRNVEEALAAFEKYNIIPTAPLPCHYLLADNETSCIVDFFDGKRHENWDSKQNYLTNFLSLKDTEDNPHSPGNCPRYKILEEGFIDCGGVIDWDRAKQWLKETSVYQPGYALPSTICSLIYQPDQLKIKLRIGKEPKRYSVTLR